MAAITTDPLSVLDELCTRIEGFGRKFTASASSGGVLVTTSDGYFLARGDETFFQNLWLLMPDMSAAADQVRTVASHANSGGTCTITVNGGNFAGAISSKSVYVLSRDPAYIMNWINEALRDERLLVTGVSWLSQLSQFDGDMQASGVTNYTSHGSPTVAKDTTDTELYQGIQSLKITNTVAGDGVYSKTIRMAHGETGTAFALMLANAATATMGVQNDSGTDLETVSCTQNEWMILRKQFGLGAADEGARLDLRASGTTDVHIWGGIAIVKDKTTLYRLPTWIRHDHEVKQLACVVMGQPGDEADTYIADDVQLQGLTRGPAFDYTINTRHGDAQPYSVRLTDRGLHFYMGALLQLTARVPYARLYGGSYAVTTWASTDLIYAPFEQVVACVQEIIGENDSAFADQRGKGALLLAESEYPDEQDDEAFPNQVPYMSIGRGF